MSGEVAFVSGGASGIGLAIAAAVAKAGGSVVIADRDSQVGAHAESLGSLYGAKTLGVSLEVTDPTSWEAALAKAIHHLGDITYFFNNAGVAGVFSATEYISLPEWQRVLAINLNGVFFGVRTLLPHIKSHGRKSYLVNTASLAGLLPMSHAAAYNASKAAVVAVSETLAAELKGSNVQVSVLCPGPVRTSILDHSSDSISSPDDGASAQRQLKHLREAIERGHEPQDVALGVLQKIHAGAFYLFAEDDYLAPLELHHRQVLAAYSGTSD